ncbi:LysR family transcriptional regulator [Rhizobium sp. P40RR-XXII]|uniref:LysR family transcriptional regulator n=1 Tax=unclassified Rhizobium TaxID=2613769 RepID=UPI00145768A6|nr:MULTISPECIES: LysR family transcriptional regulator [unclassified Rhizobium]NLR85460.1 LysR family transcriptional regulator [Rhizobium sp. P28RR-XV]NLS21286.1 LysR family transcriptional regulator [Rhizobium sp. P40RR-XXII]
MALLKTSLIHFDAAIRHGSIRKAAESLNVASSAMNRQLLQLEQEIGAELFERLPRGIRPTAAGGVLLSYIRRWSREAVLVKQEIGSLSGGVRGTIRIAAAETFTEDLLPNAMMRLQATFPHVNYTLMSGDNQRITNELLAKEADLVLAYDVSDHVRAERAHSVTDPIGIVTAPDHPLSRKDVVTRADIAEWALIAPGDDWLRHSGLKQIFEGEQTPGRIVARAERPGILKALVRSGLGIAFLSLLGVEKEVSEGKLAWIPLAPGIMEPARISLLVPRGRVQPVYMMEFIEIVKGELGEYTRANRQNLSALQT